MMNTPDDSCNPVVSLDNLVLWWLNVDNAKERIKFLEMIRICRKKCLPNSEVRRVLEVEIYILSAEVDTRNFKPKRNPVKLGMLVSVKNE